MGGHVAADANLSLRLVAVAAARPNLQEAQSYAGGSGGERQELKRIRLTLERSNSEYSQEINIRVMFLAMTPGMSTPAKAPRGEKAPETSEQPQN